MKSAALFLMGAAFSAVVMGALISYRHARALHAAEAAIKPADPRIPEPPKYPGIHEAILEQEHREPPGVLFIGDSITDFWRTVPWEWEQDFGKFHPCNAGIAWDQVQHMLWRIGHGELQGIKPQVIVLEAGTNNLGLGHDSPQATFLGICNLVRFIRGDQPDAKVLVLGLFPRKDQFDDAVKEVNRQLATVADGQHVFYLDVGARMPPEDFPDGLHPGPEGYRDWAKAMLPTLEKLYAEPTARS